MNKWCWLLLIVLCWSAAGYGIFGVGVKRGNDGISTKKEFERIVSLAPNITEILFALGLGEKVVGVPLYSEYPPETAEKLKVGTFWQPNIEAVIGAKPDLIVTLEIERQKYIAQRLRRIGYTNLTVDIEKVGDLFDAIKKIGDLTGKQIEADKLLSEIKGKLAKISSLGKNEEKLKVLYIVQRKPLRVAGRETFVNEIIELAGGENAIGPTIQKYPPIGSEQVLGSDVDVIIEPSMGQNDLEGLKIKAMEYWRGFENIPAVKNNRIYVIDDDTVSQLGPRLPEGVEAIARCLRAGSFEN